MSANDTLPHDKLHTGWPESQFARTKKLWLESSESERDFWREIFLSGTPLPRLHERLRTEFKLDVPCDRLTRFRRWLWKQDALAMAPKLSRVIIKPPAPQLEMPPRAAGLFDLLYGDTVRGRMLRMLCETAEAAPWQTGDNDELDLTLQWVYRDAPDIELTKLQERWLQMAEPQWDFWREFFCSDRSPADIRSVTQGFLKVELRDDSQVRQFARWATSMEATRQLLNN